MESLERSLPRWFWIGSAFIVAVHVAVEVVHQLVRDVPCELREIFDPAENESIGAAFVAAMLAMSGALALSLARSPETRQGLVRLTWAGLGLLLIFSAMSKIADFHRNFHLPADNMARIAIAVAVLLAGLSAVPWFFSLARPVRNLFIAALATYLTGAIGVDALSELFPESTVDDACGNEINGLGYGLANALECAFETAGFVLFASGMLKAGRSPPTA